jgi:hypothetical protein
MPDYEQNTGYIRFRYRQLESGAFAQYMSLAPVTPMGHYEIAVSTTPVGLPSIPDNCRRVVICSRGAELTYTDDGSNPSSSHGMVIPEDTVFIYDTDPDENFKMWCPSASDVRIAYYG